MQDFINFVMSLASYFILSYFIYSILRRNRKIPMIMLGIFFVSSFVDWLSIYRAGYESAIVVLYFMSRVLPVIFAFILFMMFTGGFSIGKLKFRKKLKNFSSDIQTKRLNDLMSYGLLLGSVFIGIGSYFLMEDSIQYVLMAFSGIAFVLGIVILIENVKIKNEYVILFIGRNKELTYTYQIPKDKIQLKIKDFYQNDAYIVDPIGEVVLIYSNKKIEKHYLYWIATGDQVNMENELLTKTQSVSYEKYLDTLEKYHYKKLWIRIDQEKDIEMIKDKMIK
jgi:hypothetical protein